MAIGRFVNQQATALRLIARNGEAASLQVRVDGAPADSAKPWEPAAPTTTSQTVNAVFLELANRRIDGTLVLRGDMEVLLAWSGLTVFPDANASQIVRVDGTIWEVIKVEPLQPNEEVILYSLIVRR